MYMQIIDLWCGEVSTRGSFHGRAWRCEAVTAVVVLHPGVDTDAAAVATMTAEIQSAVKKRKGSVQSPKQVIVAESVPVTALGMPDKKAVRAQFWSGAARSVG